MRFFIFLLLFCILLWLRNYRIRLRLFVWLLLWLFVMISINMIILLINIIFCININIFTFFVHINLILQPIFQTNTIIFTNIILTFLHFITNPFYIFPIRISWITYRPITITIINNSILNIFNLISKNFIINEFIFKLLINRKY